MRCLPKLFLALTVCAAGALAACTVPRDAETPGIPLGAPGLAWAAKNTDFSCSNCHGASMEQIDYAMPNKSLYALPKAKPFDDAIDFDSQIAVFMMTKVTPTLQELFNEGEGPRTKVTCFNCHPGT